MEAHGKLLAGLLGVAAALLLTYWTFVAFVGGTLWPTSIEVGGGFAFGLVWLFVIDPIAATVLYWIGMAILLPVFGAAAGVQHMRDRQGGARPEGRVTSLDGAKMTPIDADDLLNRQLQLREEEIELQARLKEDERIEGCDVCDVPVIDWRAGSREEYGRAVVSLSNRAIYLRRPDHDAEPIRIPYAELTDLAGSKGGAFVELVTWRANYLLRDVGTPAIPDKCNSIRQHLVDLHVYQQTVEVPGGAVQALVRPIEEDGPPQWEFAPTEGVDLASPEVKGTLEAELAEAIERYGPLRL